MMYLDINSTSELLSRAKDQSNKLSDSNSKYKRTVELYYIVRYFVVLYESTASKLPIQVWNEYRNALDHFARHLTLTNDISKEDQHQHLQKMEGHIQRAVLDISKFLCLYYIDFYNNIKNKDALSLVTDGSLLTDIETTYIKSREKLKNAKALDSNLGEDASLNTEVLKNYCDAVFSYKEIEDLYNQNLQKITKSQTKYNMLYKKDWRWNTAIGLLIALVFFILGKLQIDVF